MGNLAIFSSLSHLHRDTVYLVLFGLAHLGHVSAFGLDCFV
ncbi:hypothetical protein HDF17_003385 [Granulicella arctica]|uniref:Uncharacterized protein n=1 Tax=Granulicella arctica TaxID=940613 RepID=A0A7Y9PJI7_9BACT|nr:hypothetical protein [Granulicella arctica]